MHSGKPRTRSLRIGTAVLASAALAAGGLMVLASPAAAGAPVSTCVFTDPTHVNVSVDNNIGLLGLANLANVTLTDSSSGAVLGTYANVSLLDGLIDLPLTNVLVPESVSNITYTIRPIAILGGLLTPIVGSTPCAALPLQALTGSYEVLAPARILDTRTGLGVSSKIPAKSTVNLTVAGHGGVPATTGLLGILGSSASAVNINLTATNAGAAGFLTVYPTGSPRPGVSNLNFAPGKDIANTAITQLGTSGSISIYNDSTKPVDLIGDVSGYYNAGLLTALVPLTPGAYQPITPARLLDTRTAGTAGKVPSQHTVSFSVAHISGVPLTGIGSVVLNVTATGPTSKGHLRVYPSGTTLPFASNVNFDPGKTVANEVVVAPGTDGNVTIFNGAPNGTTDVVVDVVGFIANGVLPLQTPGLQNAVTPLRILDTRYGIGAPKGQVAAGGMRTVQVVGKGAGINAVPTDARAAIVTVTATNEMGSGYATVYPGPTRPTASILNFVHTTDVANVMIAPINTDGTITIYNGSSEPTDLVIDIASYITGATLSIG